MKEQVTKEGRHEGFVSLFFILSYLSGLMLHVCVKMLVRMCVCTINRRISRTFFERLFASTNQLPLPSHSNP